MDTYLFGSLDDTFKTEEDCVRFLRKDVRRVGFVARVVIIIYFI